MYADNTLTPKEAARLCALGTLASESKTYGALAEQVRHFIDRVQGPTLDVLGSSLELLKYEGLVESQGDGDDAPLRITSAGRAELETLLTADVRPGATDLNKLIVALKFRFLHLLDAAAQADQVDALVDVAETELARLTDLRGHHSAEPGHLPAWLDREIDELESHLTWLGEFKDGLA
ncbi:MAG: hypothetical protein OXR84_05705 [Magnetovibrio sp.]|nr:hypothetical protein [Magnetovibrio sp.]